MERSRSLYPLQELFTLAREILRPEIPQVQARVPDYSNGVTSHPNLYTDSVIVDSHERALNWYFQEVPGY